MAHIKLHRANPSIDMTPMVDVAFLLVTFFILVTQFVAKEAVEIDMPSSTNDIKVSKDNMITVSLSDDGRVFFDMAGKFDRIDLIEKMNEQFKLGLTDEEKNSFALMTSFGVPLSGLKQFLQLPTDERDKVTQPGIPVDMGNNELDDWIMFARGVNMQARFFVKGDKDASYEKMGRVLDIITKEPVHILKFALITNLESSPTEPEPITNP